MKLLKGLIGSVIMLSVISMTGCSSSVKKYDNDQTESITVLLKKESVSKTGRYTEKRTIENEILANVFEGKHKFYDVELKKHMYLDDYSSTTLTKLEGFDEYNNYVEKSSVVNNDEPLELTRWCETDMDSDGTKELILEFVYGNLLLLHEENNDVYGYSFTFRGMNSIKYDGSFSCSGSANSTYIGKLEFSKEKCIYNELCALDEVDKNNPLYRVNKKNTTREEAKSFLEEQKQKEDAEWNWNGTD